MRVTEAPRRASAHRPPLISITLRPTHTPIPSVLFLCSLRALNLDVDDDWGLRFFADGTPRPTDQSTDAGHDRAANAGRDRDPGYQLRRGHQQHTDHGDGRFSYTAVATLNLHNSNSTAAPEHARRLAPGDPNPTPIPTLAPGDPNPTAEPASYDTTQVRPLVNGNVVSAARSQWPPTAKPTAGNRNEII